MYLYDSVEELGCDLQYGKMGTVKFVFLLLLS